MFVYWVVESTLLGDCSWLDFTLWRAELSEEFRVVDYFAAVARPETPGGLHLKLFRADGESGLYLLKVVD